MARASFISSSEAMRLAGRLLFALGLFWLLNVIIFLPLNYMYFHSYSGNSGAQINNILRSKADIYILGHSKASHHYDSRLLSAATGLSVFNAGADGKNAVYQNGLLKMLLKRHKPKAIIYEAGDLITEFEGGTVDLFPYFYQDKEIRHLLELRDKWAVLKFLFPLYAYNNKIILIINGFLKKTPPPESGYEPLDGTLPPRELKRLYDLSKQQKKPLPLDSYALKCLTETISLCHDNRIKVIFVYSPTYLPTDPDGQQHYIKLSEQFSIPYLSYGKNDKYNWNKDWFRDAVHLNRQGAGAFTKNLISDLDWALLGIDNVTVLAP
jgi:hypothetical protein